MEAAKVLKVVLREMCQYGYAWRNDWRDFDGRRLRNQLEELEEWAEQALKSPDDLDYLEGTKFYDCRGGVRH